MSENPCFTYSFAKSIVLEVILMPLPVLALVSNYFSDGSSLGYAVYSAIALLMIGAIVRQYSKVVHRASFFEEYFEFSGRRLHRRVPYSDLDRATRIVRVPVFDSRVQVEIRIKGEPEPILIPYNPRNKKLKTDLYGWLTTKSEELGSASASA